MPRKVGALVRNPTKDTDRARAWAAMRIMRVFTMPELSRTSGAAISNITKLLGALGRHGYVRKRPGYAGGRPGICQQYILIDDSGPKHPLVCSRCGCAIMLTKTCNREAGHDQ